MRIKYSRIDAFCLQMQSFLSHWLDHTCVKSPWEIVVLWVWLILQVRLILHKKQEWPLHIFISSPPLHNSFFFPHFLVFIFSVVLTFSLFFHRKAQHHQTQVSMAWPLPHFSEPAKGFTWYLLSRFHLGSVTKQKHRQDEKEMVSQGPEWDLEELDSGWKLTLRCYHTPPPSSPLLTSSFFFFYKILHDLFFLKKKTINETLKMFSSKSTDVNFSRAYKGFKGGNE